MLNTEQIVFLQNGLNVHHNSNLMVDGIDGPATKSAVEDACVVSDTWTMLRRYIGTLQYYISTMGYDIGQIDGYWGQITDSVFDDIMDAQNQKSKFIRPDDMALTGWPSATTDALINFYGKPGTGHGKVNSPYPLKLAWDTNTTINRFTAHSKIVTSVETILGNVLSHYGIDEIKRLKLDMWGGCFNNRKMRGGSRLSTHAFACAIDWNPAENRLRQNSKTAVFARPEYDKWWEFWEAEGGLSLGRSKDFDWMHVQFTL